MKVDIQHSDSAITVEFVAYIKIFRIKHSTQMETLNYLFVLDSKHTISNGTG